MKRQSPPRYAEIFNLHSTSVFITCCSRSIDSSSGEHFKSLAGRVRISVQSLFQDSRGQLTGRRVSSIGNDRKVTFNRPAAQSANAMLPVTATFKSMGFDSPTIEFIARFEGSLVPYLQRYRNRCHDAFSEFLFIQSAKMLNENQV